MAFFFLKGARRLGRLVDAGCVAANAQDGRTGENQDTKAEQEHLVENQDTTC